jgi:uncharacterized damage-inducible protein DinB
MEFSTEHLLRMLDESFGRTAWHGTNLRGSIRGLTPDQASWRPALGRHNIWEIVVHAAYWKYAVRNRFAGGKRGSFACSGSNWFPRSGKEGLSAWKKDVALLEHENRALREAVAALPAQRLRELSTGKKWTLAEMVMGVAFHDIYHTGQIQLLKRLQK